MKRVFFLLSIYLNRVLCYSEILCLTSTVITTSSPQSIKITGSTSAETSPTAKSTSMTAQTTSRTTSTPATTTVSAPKTNE